MSAVVLSSDVMGWDGMGWDGMGWDGLGWVGMGRCGMGLTGWMGSAYVCTPVSMYFVASGSLPYGCRGTSVHGSVLAGDTLELCLKIVV